MEEKVEKKEQSTVEEMIATFRKGWDTVANLLHQLTGLEEGAARNALLVAIAPLLTAVATFVNWVYLYVHYHVIYNVPANDLTVSTALLVRFAAIVIAIGIVVCVSYLMLKFIRKHMKFLGKPLIIITISVILIVVIVCVAFIQYRYKINYDGKIITAQFSNNTSTNEIDIVVGLIKVGTFLIKGITGLCQWLSNVTVLLTTLLVSFAISAVQFMLEKNFYFNKGKKPNVDKKKCSGVAVQIAIIVMVIALPILLFMFDDSLTRASPYAITSDQTQVIVYRDKEYCILEPATIDTETNTLTIDTSQPKPGDAGSLTYGYVTFENVIIK